MYSASVALLVAFAVACGLHYSGGKLPGLCACDFVYRGSLSRSSHGALVFSSTELQNSGIFMHNISALDRHCAALTLHAVSPGVYEVPEPDARKVTEVHYTIDFAQEQRQAPLSLLTSHCDVARSHVLLNGYTSFAWVHGLENATYGIGIQLPGNWKVASTLLSHSKRYGMSVRCSESSRLGNSPYNNSRSRARPEIFFAATLYDLLDSLFLLARDDLLFVSEVVSPWPLSGDKGDSRPVATTVLAWSAIALPGIRAKRLEKATRTAMLAVQQLGGRLYCVRRTNADLKNGRALPPVGDCGGVSLKDSLNPEPYTVVVELFAPFSNLPFLYWAMEHQHAFQAAEDNTIDDVSDLRLTYHFAHHIYHSFFLPMRVYTDQEWPRRCWHTKCSTGFMWFHEGFAQYNAFAGLARAQVFPLSAVLTQLFKRFAVPYLGTPFPNKSLVDLSHAIGTSDELFMFMNFGGALLGMLLDYQLRLRDCSVGLHESVVRLG
eukprot:RCo038375